MLKKIYQELKRIRETLQNIQNDLKCFPREKDYSIHISNADANNLVKKNNQERKMRGCMR